MGKLHWTKGNLTSVNSSEVCLWFDCLVFKKKMSASVIHLSALLLCTDFLILLSIQKRLRKWDRTWLKFPSRTVSGKAPPEPVPVSPSNPKTNLLADHFPPTVLQSAAWNGKMFCASLQINLNVAFEISTDFSDFIQIMVFLSEL